MDIDCMSDSSCGYEDFDSLDFLANTSSTLKNFENCSCTFWQDTTFEMPITNQVTYCGTPTLIKVVSGNSSKYLLLQPPQVRSSSSENVDPNAPVIVDVTEKVVEVPLPNLPVTTCHNASIPNTQTVSKRAPRKSVSAAKKNNKFSILKKVKNPAIVSLNHNLTSALKNAESAYDQASQEPSKRSQKFSNDTLLNQEVVPLSQGSINPSLCSLNIFPPIHGNTEIACNAGTQRSTNSSSPRVNHLSSAQDSLEVGCNAGLQRSTNSLSPLVNLSSAQDSIEIAFNQLFEELHDEPSPLHQNIQVALNQVLQGSASSPLQTSAQQLTNFQNKPEIINNEERKGIATLVFFDLETTGLAHTIGTSNVQITELSLIAVDRHEFCESENADLKDVRIIHKLSMVVKPRSSICPIAARITGLDNAMLKNQEIFDKNTAGAIVSFLSHLSKPACLLAHNGKCFDFPLLRAELKRNGTELPDGTFMADTLTGLRAVGVPNLPLTPKTPKSIKCNKDGRLSMSLENLHIYFFNRKHQGRHSSEGDCIALAKICHKMKDRMVPWIDQNCVSGNTIKPMW